MDESIQNLVSIVLVTYNSSKYVIETLESIKNQTYKNIELIISDDHSRDDTVEICKKWLLENNNYFVRTELLSVEKNTGIAANLNRGLSIANGEWLKFFAGDDIMHSNCIELFMEYIHLQMNENVRFVFSRFELINEESLKILKQPRSDFFTAHEGEFECSARKQFLNLLNINFIAAPTSFINRSILLELNGFDEKNKLMEDFPLWLKATYDGHKMYFIKEKTISYRVSETSLSENINEGFVLMYEEIIKSYFGIKNIFRYPFHYIHFKLLYYNKKRFIKGKQTHDKYTKYIDPLIISQGIKKRLFKRK